MRLDAWLVSTGAVRSRERAKEAVMGGLVRVNGRTATKISQTVAETDHVECDGEVHDYVSRGALKLVAGLDHFGSDPESRICLDLGASTGGFTEVLLRRGAAKVYAVDVGHGQLHETLRRDPRVINMEGVHARKLHGPGEDHREGDAERHSEALVSDPIDLIVCDVSFISIMKALPFALALAAPRARLVTLVKPQFELGPSHIGKGGLVTMAPDQQRDWVDRVIIPFLAEQGWQSEGLIDSPITGGDGNTEFLLGARRAT